MNMKETIFLEESDISASFVFLLMNFYKSASSLLLQNFDDYKFYAKLFVTAASYVLTSLEIAIRQGIGHLIFSSQKLVGRF